MTTNAIHPLHAGSRPRLEPHPQSGKYTGTGTLLCGYCGKDMTEILMYKGGRGYSWVFVCPDRCHPDKYDKQMILEV